PGKFVSAIDTRENKPVLKPEGSPAFLDQVERKLIEPPARAGAAKSLPVYPTQLMESFNALLICLIGSFFFRCRKRYGEVFFLVGILYCAQRFVLEILRDDNPAIFLGLTISQNLSIVFGIICLVLFVQSRRLPPNVAATAAAGVPPAGMPAAKPRKGATAAGG
ncbi:MAG TPA: prolipoprotein diacylglyceryl transferase family protein, partial [Planctomycetota bacterium]|nr:prolipoprotein diacylglyceryl transferase family protein [Planctomycetota bacterium]